MQRWLSDDRSDYLRTAISDKLDVLLALLQRLRDYKLTNSAHRASLGEAGLAAVRIWERMLADLRCGAVSDCPEGHPLKPRPNHPKGRRASHCRRHTLTLPPAPVAAASCDRCAAEIRKGEVAAVWICGVQGCRVGCASRSRQNDSNRRRRCQRIVCQSCSLTTRNYSRFSACILNAANWGRRF